MLIIDIMNGISASNIFDFSNWISTSNNVIFLYQQFNFH